MDLIGYARVVPRENAEEALAHQKARIEAYCKEHGHKLVDFYSEKISAEFELQEGRSELEKAIHACSRDIGLIVIRLDRLSSNKKVLIKIFEECQTREVQIVPVSGAKDPSEIKTSIEVTVIPGK
jgi:DNA invertase Pin-like site-specific DNA recombinase